MIPPSKSVCVMGGGNEQEGYFMMEPMDLGLVIPSLGRSLFNFGKADKVSCKKTVTVFNFLTEGIPF